MTFKNHLFSGLYTVHRGERLTEENLRFLGFDPENVGILTDADSLRELSEANIKEVSPHNHTSLSTCASNKNSLEEIAKAARRQGVTHLFLTDHDQLAIDKPNYDYGLEFHPGTEVKTQFYEFNVVDFQNEEDGQSILDVRRFGKYRNIDDVFATVDRLNETERYKNGNRILVGFNHPFSEQMILGAQHAVRIIKPGYEVRTGFDFKGYILDKWDKNELMDLINRTELGKSFEEFKQNKLERVADEGFEKDDESYQIRKFFLTDKTARRKALRELKIDAFVDNYLIDTNYRVDPLLSRKFQQHEDIITDLMEHFDYVEFNTFNYWKSDCEKAVLLANKYDKQVIVGEDTHFTQMIGKKGMNIIRADMPFDKALDQRQILPVVTALYQNGLINYLTSAWYRTRAGLNKQVVSKSVSPF